MKILLSGVTKFRILLPEMLSQGWPIYFYGPERFIPNLASPVRVKQNLCTFASCGKLWVSIQLLVLNKCAMASSSGLPENSGLKYDQLNCGT